MNELNTADRLLIEGIRELLSAKSPHIGLIHKDEATDTKGFQYLHEHINDLFHVRAAELTHSTAVCAAFQKVHSYKFINDDFFNNALNAEMKSMAVPGVERTKALKFVEQIAEEINGDENWLERDAGFNPNLDEVVDTISDYGSDNKFNIEDRRLNSQNVKVVDNDGRPGKITSQQSPDDGYDAESNED